MLVCVGDLLEEVLVRLPSDPVRGRDTVVRSARVRGGSAANVAALTAEQGRDARFVGQAGDDTVGRVLVEDLRRRGADLVVHLAGGTGLIVTMVGESGRTRLVDRGASRRLAMVAPHVLDGASRLYLAANAFAEDPLAAAVDRLVGDAADRGIPIVVGGPSAADLDSIGAGPFLELITALSPEAVVLNRLEHASLGLAARAPVPGAATTVVTGAGRPSLVIDATGHARAVEVTPVDGIRDRTGVGDGFLAGYLGARHAGADPVSATRAGHRLAGEVLRRLGPTSRP